jgi:acyl carrier protein
MIRTMDPEPAPTRPKPDDRAEVVALLRGFVAQWFRDGREDGLADEAPLVTSGIIDSAGVLEVLDFVERRFGVRILDEEISVQNCNTLAAWGELILSKRPPA